MRHWLSRVLLIDAEDGALLGHYWHGGKIGYVGSQMFDTDGDFEEEIVVSGFNNPMYGRLMPRPAAQAGIRAGDVIIEAGREDVFDWPDLRYVLAFSWPGDTLPVVVVRNDERLRFKVVLGEPLLALSSPPARR